MMCLVFTIAVFCLTLAGLSLMVGWKSGAAQLARIAFALVLGGAVVSWFVESLRSFFAEQEIRAVAGGLAVLLFLAVAVLVVGWLFKRRSVAASAVRPTIRRRAQLAELDEHAPHPAEPRSASTDDLQLFGDSP
jgi:hypothetical protein